MGDAIAATPAAGTRLAPHSADACMNRISLLLFLSLAAGKVLAGSHPSASLDERHWAAVRKYYNDQMRAGVCPIGFVKKEQGCEAPAQPRRWAVGKPLPSNVIRFDVPPALAAKLGKPPAGHRFVRVGPDILLVSNNTRQVADGVLNLGRR